MIMLKDKERFDIVAHFPSEDKARTAEEIFGGRLGDEMPVSFAFVSGLGLGIGVLLGAATGYLLARSALVTFFSPALMLQRELLSGLLWAAILGATGWVAGSVAHLFSSPVGLDTRDLHITVQAEKLAEMRRLLVAEGASAVSIKSRSSKKRHALAEKQLSRP